MLNIEYIHTRLLIDFSTQGRGGDFLHNHLPHRRQGHGGEVAPPGRPALHLHTRN